MAIFQLITLQISIVNDLNFELSGERSYKRAKFGERYVFFCER